MGRTVATGREGNLGRALRAVFEGGAAAGLTDAQLVDRVAGGGEPARTAMAAVVSRHGPMVLRACRAGARDEHDADDAFQAVFLVLARKAGSIRVAESLAPWLHGVALRTTAAARVASARRRALDRRRAESRGPAATAPDSTPDDLATLIHEELGRLPDRYRSALVLCDLEGLSHEEAARRLGCPVGTIKSRQARGRERLRGRLIRRGIAPAVAIGVSSTSASAGTVLPESLATASVDAAIRFLDGTGRAGAVPAASVTLARKALTAMMLSRLKSPALALLAFGAIAAGAATILRGSPQAPARGPVAAGEPARPAFTLPAPGSLLQLRWVADASRDAPAISKAIHLDLDKAPDGYRWFMLDDAFAVNHRGGLTIRRDRPDGPEWVLLRLDPQNVTERDLARVTKGQDSGGHPVIPLLFTRDGARRFGELMRSRLPEDGDQTEHKLATVVEGRVVAAGTVRGEITHLWLLDFSTPPGAAEVDRLFANLTRVAEANTRPTVQAAPSQAAALRLAREVDIPTLAGADRVTIEKSANGDLIRLIDPRAVAALRDSLKIRDVPPSAGLRVATLIFSRGDTTIREVWVYEGGEWGFVRPGTSWTVGQSDDLWGLLKPRLEK